MNESTEANQFVRRRNGDLVAFHSGRIANALASAYLRDADGAPRHAGGNELTPAERDKVQYFTGQVVRAVIRRPDAAEHPIDIEEIQDQVELALMRYGDHAIARDYVLYRESRRRERVSTPGASSATAGERGVCR